MGEWGETRPGQHASAWLEDHNAHSPEHADPFPCPAPHPPPAQSLRLSSLVVFLATGFISIGTFKNIAGLSNTKPVALWIVYYAFSAVCILLYIVSQLVLVIRTLDDRWPIGDIIFGVAFFVVGQVLVYGFSVQICDAIKHYLDGLFFGTLCTLLAVMMVYKYYDTITKEDLEFSVGSKQAVWEVKESLLGPSAPSAFGLNGAGAGGGGYGGYGAGDDGQMDNMMPPYSHPAAAGNSHMHGGTQGGGGQYYSSGKETPSLASMQSYGAQSGYGMQGYPPSKGGY